MDDKEPMPPNNLSVPDQIFQKFFEDLKIVGVSPDVIAQLQIAISEKENPSDLTIKAALFAQNNSL
jgi:hypothetical protein